MKILSFEISVALALIFCSLCGRTIHVKRSICGARVEIPEGPRAINSPGICYLFAENFATKTNPECGRFFTRCPTVDTGQ
jgi:hypothetical protein